MLNEELKDYFRKLLKQRLEALASDEKKSPEGFSDMQEESPDPIDQASMESDRDFSFRIRERESRLIAKINDALERIEDGTYGICEKCGRPISMERLKARPVTTLCIRCKKKQETAEKLRGE
jgi:DnaK suppressor protein